MTTIPNQPRQDKDLGLNHGKLPDGREVTFFNEDLALRIVERLAAGDLLRDICADPGMPHWTTFHRWVVLSPPLARAYHAARELSAQAFEEEAIGMARTIKETQKDGTQVRAFEVAMNQLRWSAARRDPGRFGDKTNVSVRVPIQINTSLNLGEDTVTSTVEYPNIYTLEATVVEAGNAAVPQDPGETPLLTPNRARPKPKALPKPLSRVGPRKKVLKPRVADPSNPFLAPFSGSGARGPGPGAPKTEQGGPDGEPV